MNDQKCKLKNSEFQNQISKINKNMPDATRKVINTDYKIDDSNYKSSETNFKDNFIKISKNNDINSCHDSFEMPNTNYQILKTTHKLFGETFNSLENDDLINNNYINRDNFKINKDQISSCRINQKFQNLGIQKPKIYHSEIQNFDSSNYNKEINNLNDQLTLKKNEVNFNNKLNIRKNLSKNDLILEKNFLKNDSFRNSFNNELNSENIFSKDDLSLQKIFLKNNFKKINKNDNQLIENLDNKIIDSSLINKKRSKKRILPNPTVKFYIDFPYSLTKDNKNFDRNLNENFEKFSSENKKNFVMKNLSLNIQSLKTENTNQFPVKYFFEYRPSLISPQIYNQSSKYTLENLAKKNNFFDDLSFSLNLDPLQLSSYQNSSRKLKDSSILENLFFNYKLMNSIKNKLTNPLTLKTKENLGLRNFDNLEILPQHFNAKIENKNNLNLFETKFNEELIKSKTNNYFESGNNFFFKKNLNFKNDVFKKNLIPDYENIKLNFALNSRLVHIVKQNKLDQKIKNYSNYLYKEDCGIILCLGLSTLPNLKYFIGYYVANIVYNSVAQGILNVGDIVLAINSIQLNLNSKMSLEKASELLNQQFNSNRYLQLKIVPRNLITNQPLFYQKNYETILSSDHIRTVVIDNKLTKPLGLTIKGGKKYGFGIIISSIDKNSLSEKAGLKPGDLILSLNGHDFLNLDHNQAAFLLQTISIFILKVRYVGFEPLSALLYNIEDGKKNFSSTFEMSNDKNLKLSYLSKNENMFEFENNSNNLLNHKIEFLPDKTMKDHYLKSIVNNYEQNNLDLNNSFIVPHLPPCIKDFDDYSLPIYLIDQNNYYDDNLDQEIENELKLEEQINLILNPIDRKIFLSYKNEFFSKKITLNFFVYVICKLLDTNEKRQVFKYLRPLIPIDDLALFDQLVISFDLDYKNFNKEFNQNNSSKLYRSNSFDDRLMDQENWMNNYSDYHNQNHLPLIDSLSPKRPSRFLSDFKPMSPYLYQNNLNQINNYQQSTISPYTSSKSYYYPNHDLVNQISLESQNFINSQNSKIYQENLNEELYNPSNNNKNYKVDQSYSQTEKHLVNNSMNNFKRHRSLPADTFPRNLNNFTPITSNLNQSHVKNTSLKLPVRNYDEDIIRVKIIKSKPILGIAIEGGINVENQVQPRIISIHETGSAFDSGELKVGHIILEIDGVPTEGLTHSEVAKLLAYSYYTSAENFIELVVKNKTKNLNYS